MHYLITGVLPELSELPEPLFDPDTEAPKQTGAIAVWQGSDSEWSTVRQVGILLYSPAAAVFHFACSIPLQSNSPAY